MQQAELAETIERAALVAWFRAASGLALPDFDWRLEEVDDALCSVSATEPSILMNRVLGLGSHASPNRAQLEEIKRIYADAGVSRFFLHVVPHLCGPETERLLTEAGFRRYRGWMKFHRGTADVDPVQTEFTVRRIEPDESAEFARIAASAFDMLPATQPVIAALANDPDWRLYMSFAGTHAAGTGAVYVKRNFAQIDWGATYPDFRRRGSQSAILSARINDALAAGCTTIVTMTGEAVPGDPQNSYNNILRRGFAEAYLRENWIPADTF